MPKRFFCSETVCWIIFEFRAFISWLFLRRPERIKELARVVQTYAVSQGGKYPDNMALLTDAKPPYIRINYCDKTLDGFQYSCIMGADSYEFVASPVVEGETGSEVYIDKFPK